MWKHNPKVKFDGVKGELSYVREELNELYDAHHQGVSNLWPLVEASDVLIAVGKFTNAHYEAPLWAILLLGYVRIPYKFFRNRWLDWRSVKKS